MADCHGPLSSAVVPGTLPVARGTMTPMNDAYDELRTQLETISERLGDRSIEVLREAIESGAPSRPTEDKLIGRARSAVDKAAGLLRQASESTGD